VTAPDSTDSPTAASAVTSKVAKTKRGRGGSKGLTPGQPEATSPLPGQSNPSVPQITLPPAVQQLLNEIPKLGGGATGVPQVGPNGTPPADAKSADKLLDFLLAP
jgi:hypothetical protein